MKQAGLTTVQPGARFCALQYRRPVASENKTPANAGPVILLVLENARGGLDFLAAPNWRETIDEEDLIYIDDLLNDWRERREREPEALFLQLSSLAVGPLLASKVGRYGSDDAYLQSNCSHFVPLWKNGSETA